MKNRKNKYIKIAIAAYAIAFGHYAFGQEPLIEGKSSVNDSLIVAENAPKLKGVNVAYTFIDGREINSAISSVSGEDLRKTNSPNLQNALIGRLSGLSVFPSNYEPGNSDYSAYVRGLKTTTTNAPLVLVDQIERDLSQLSPNEIESVTVLKDAAALALYGGRGANGVILVTTKRGEIAPRKVTVDGSYSLQQTVGMRDYLNAYDYVQLYNKAWELDGKNNAFYSDEDVEGYRKTVENDPDANPYLYPNNNYIDEYINNITYQKKVDVTMSGGNKDARYFALVGYLSQDGVFKYGEENNEYSTNTNYQRFNFRSNVDINVNSMVSAFLDMAGRIEIRHYPGSSAWDIFNQLSTTPSNAYPIFNEDGSLGGTTSYQKNPYGMIAQSGYTEAMRRLFDASVGFKVDMNNWIEGLSFTTRAGFDFNNAKNRGLSKNFMVYEFTPSDSTYLEYGNTDYSTFGGVDAGGVFYNQWFGHSQFDYARVFKNKHRVNALAFFDVNQRSIPGNNPSFKNVAFGMQFRYNYNYKYFVDLVASTTANESYMRGSRFNTFPALALGWALSEENFLKDNNIVDYLKLRASAGLTGSDRPYGTNNSYRFLYRNDWSTGGNGYSFGNPQDHIGGSYESTVGNQKLRGEVGTKLNVGFDGDLLKSKLYFTTDVYYEKRSGIWAKRTVWVPSTYGGALPLENAGSTESKGWELTLGSRKTVGDFIYDIKLMADYSKSKILDLKEAPKEWDYQYEAGKQIGEMWMLTSQGFFTNDDEIENSAPQFGTVRPGDIKYVDYNEDGTVDANDVNASGKNWYPELIFSFNSDVSYKNIDFSMLWQGTSGSYTYDPLYEIPFWNKNASTNASLAWTPETAETAKYPRLTTSNFTNNSKGSDFWLVDNNYIRLKSVELGYTISNAKLKHVGFEKIRMYVNAYNLLTFSNNNFDPEHKTAGIDQYPASRVYSFGLNFTF
ncbi:MAG: SusC/RagA family TonB-linked outer membrane protein [Prolixibacteraceae bacterium]|jgi:TonB-linked SusC/RagA family outer membrane protein|nr:SusC/RagA family TonB-linked outer membrane protein [Prolixibacteraceae bacterium]